MGLRESWPQHRPYTEAEKAFAAAMVARYRNEGYCEFECFEFQGAEERRELRRNKKTWKNEVTPQGKISASNFAWKYHKDYYAVRKFCEYHAEALGRVGYGARFFYDEAKLLEAYTNRKKRRPSLYSQAGRAHDSGTGQALPSLVPSPLTHP